MTEMNIQKTYEQKPKLFLYRFFIKRIICVGMHCKKNWLYNEKNEKNVLC